MKENMKKLVQVMVTGSFTLYLIIVSFVAYKVLIAL